MVKKTLCALLATSTIGLLGCVENIAEGKPKDITISGKPISVAYTSNTYSEYGAFAGVFEVDGKLLLAYRSRTGEKFASNQDESLPNAKAAAVVQSEMNDGDNELVSLTGQYRKNQFELSSIEANGYKIDF